MFIKYNCKSILFGLALFINFSSLTTPILCQTKNYIILSEIFSKGKSDINSLEQFTFEINKRTDISDVFIVGNLSSDGSDIELNRVKAILDQLKTSYKVLGGYNDYSSSIFQGKNISNVFEEDEFIKTDDDILILGINSNIAGINNKGFIKIETLNRIKESIKLEKIKVIIILSSQELSLIQNRFEFLNLFDNKKIFFLSPSSSINDNILLSQKNITEIKIPTQSNENINSSVLQLSEDSLFIKPMKRTEKQSDLMINVGFDNLSQYKKINNKVIMDSSILLSKSIDNNSTTNTSLLSDEIRIFITLGNGLVYCYDFNGREIFVSEIMGSILNNSVLYKDLFLAATIEGDLYSLNSNNGDVLQVVGIGEKITSDLVLIDVIKPSFAGKAILLGTSEGNIYCYDAFTFELLWKQSISKFAIVSNFLITKDKIIFQDSRSNTYCINSKSGVLIWKYELNESSVIKRYNTLLSDGNKIFFYASNEIIAIDLLQGKKVWNIKIKDSTNKLYLNNKLNKLFTINDKGMMLILSVADGKEIKRIDFKKSGLFSFCLTEQDDIFYVGFSDGSIYSLHEDNGFRELISADFIPIISIDMINKKTLTALNKNGSLFFYKFSK